MMYCWKCPLCGLRSESQLSHYCECGALMKRDYRAEGVGLGSGVRASRETLSDDGYRKLFLPEASDYAGQPGDPTGEKGLREWREEHTPAHKTHIEPVMERTQF